MTKTHAAARIRSYVADNFLYMRPGLALADTDSLLATGVIDSMGVIELITFVSDELGVAIADEDITEQIIGTIDALAAYVAARA